MNAYTGKDIKHLPFDMGLCNADIPVALIMGLWNWSGFGDLGADGINAYTGKDIKHMPFDMGLVNAGYTSGINNGIMEWLRNRTFAIQAIMNNAEYTKDSLIMTDAQQVDSAEASTIAVPPSEPSGSPR